MDKTAWFGEHKGILTFLLLLLIIVLFLGGAKLYLFAKFLLGSDIIVSLDSDSVYLSMMQGEQKEVSFSTRVTTNPFCKPECSYDFQDISKGNLIEQSAFNLLPGIATSKEFTITAPQTGFGTNLYRFSINCKARPTALCHTSGESATRSILITTDYGLTENEKINYATYETKLKNLSDNLKELKINFASTSNSINNTKTSLDFSDVQIQLNLLNEEINSTELVFQELNSFWTEQDYRNIDAKISEAKSNIEATKNKIVLLNEEINSTGNEYNLLLDTLYLAKFKLDESTKYYLINGTIFSTIQKTIADFNDATFLFNQKNKIDFKREIVNNISKEVDSLNLFLKEENKKQTLNLEIQTDLTYDVLCELTSNCVTHKSIFERANETNYDLKSTCSYLEDSKSKLKNSIIPNESIDLKQLVKDTKQNITNEYLRLMPVDYPNTLLIRSIINFADIQNAYVLPENISEPEKNSAIARELSSQQQDSCIPMNLVYVYVNEISSFRFDENITNQISTIESQSSQSFVFSTPTQTCCVNQNCNPCCTEESCLDDSKNYPLVFIHGHAFNKDVSAEYSLEAFNKIQNKLQEDGFLNAGAITLYSEHDIPAATWGKFNVPFSIRASYYFDLFKQPENYVVVQTNSENIDTYAIRLKDLVETIQYKTGKPKVNIIAFSMGGLVTRRYIQLFGESKVNKLILVGTPNRGISGGVANYCGLIGANLECRDLNEDSLLINKLSNAAKPNIPITNVVGTGCNMDGEQGDGVVLESSAKLDFAENYIINGTCRGATKPLHTDLLDTDFYPVIYEVIKNALIVK